MLPFLCHLCLVAVWPSLCRVLVVCCRLCLVFAVILLWFAIFCCLFLVCCLCLMFVVAVVVVVAVCCCCCCCCCRVVGCFRLLLFLFVVRCALLLLLVLVLLLCFACVCRVLIFVYSCLVSALCADSSLFLLFCFAPLLLLLQLYGFAFAVALSFALPSLNFIVFLSCRLVVSSSLWFCLAFVLSSSFWAWGGLWGPRRAKQAQRAAGSIRALLLLLGLYGFAFAVALSFALPSLLFIVFLSCRFVVSSSLWFCLAFVLPSSLLLPLHLLTYSRR